MPFCILNIHYIGCQHCDGLGQTKCGRTSYTDIRLIRTKFHLFRRKAHIFSLILKNQPAQYGHWLIKQSFLLRMTAFLFISINNASMKFFECPLDTGTRLINVPLVSVLVRFHRMIFLNLNHIHKLVVVKVTRPSFFGGVPSYFEALWYPHLYFYRKFNT